MHKQEIVVRLKTTLAQMEADNQILSLAHNPVYEVLLDIRIQKLKDPSDFGESYVEALIEALAAEFMSLFRGDDVDFYLREIECHDVLRCAHQKLLERFGSIKLDICKAQFV